jgi:hypothetical protein
MSDFVKSRELVSCYVNGIEVLYGVVVLFEMWFEESIKN